MQILLLQLYKVTIGIPELIPKRVVHAIPMYSDMICRHKPQGYKLNFLRRDHEPLRISDVHVFWN